MSELERNAILKAALLLVLLEGWTTTMVVQARLGTDPRPALGWLAANGFAATAAAEHEPVRWRPQHTFEELWGRLVPERRCPVSLCGRSPRESRAGELR